MPEEPLRNTPRLLRFATILTIAFLVSSACAGPAGTPPTPVVVGEGAGENPSAGTETGSTLTDGMPPEGPRQLIRADFPTSIAISRTEELFFAERSGRIWKADLSGGRPKGDSPLRLVAHFEVSTEGERGLLGIALHPDYPQTPYLYVFLSPASKPEAGEVHLLELEDATVVRDSVIVEFRSGRGCCHKGGRLAFGPDRKLYVTLGDGQIPTAATDISDLRGKILRYEPDGSTPKDGPFGADSPVWAYGVRNPFGLAFSADGDAFFTDNGPSGGDGPRCCDEINRLQSGSNYGWPDSFGPRHNQGLAPIWHSGDSVVVPTGIAVVSSERFGALSGAVVFCSFAERRMFVIDREGRDWKEGLSTPGRGPQGCSLDVKQGPDGRIYFADADAVYVWG